MGAVTDIGHIAMTTTLAAAAGAVAAMFTAWKMFDKPDISMTLNGALAGLEGTRNEINRSHDTTA